MSSIKFEEDYIFGNNRTITFSSDIALSRDGGCISTRHANKKHKEDCVWKKWCRKKRDALFCGQVFCWDLQS